MSDTPFPNCLAFSAACLACTLLGSGRAAASASPLPAPPVALPGITIVGVAGLSAERVEIRCGEPDPVDGHAGCTITARARVRAIEPVVLELPEPGRAHVTLDGDATDALEVALPPGMEREVGLSFDQRLGVRARDRDAPWIVTPVRARHIVLGESPGTEGDGDGAAGVLFDGVLVHTSGDIEVVAEGGSAVSVQVGGAAVDGHAHVEAPRPSMSISLDPGGHDDPVFQNGGPYVAAAGTADADAEDFERFTLRAGYEFALYEHVLFGAALETDFDSVAESVLVEIASPELLVIVPSVSAGIGAVFRQLGQRDADAALRIRVGYNLFAIGVLADFDYWPAIGSWTVTAAIRASI